MSSSWTAICQVTLLGLILLDSHSQIVMDGIEATKRIRALGFRGRMFGVTGNALGEDMDEFLSSGLDKVLTKPLNMEKLIQAMQGQSSTLFCLCLTVDLPLEMSRINLGIA